MGDGEDGEGGGVWAELSLAKIAQVTVAEYEGGKGAGCGQS